MAFREKNHLLALYNAVNGSAYEDPEALEIRTLEDAIYMGMKNDASFVLDDVLSLWEHQSTWNPNMPVRALSYFARLYQSYIQEHGLNVYSTKLQRLPFPQYLVFYNGLQEEPDRTELRLSDAFIRSPAIPEGRKPSLEVRAVMLNINWGHNQELMEHCKRLREYSQCIATIREYGKIYEDREEGVAKAVDRCIAEGMLADILSKNKAEVITLFLTEFDEQAYRRMMRKEAWEDGHEEGREEGLEEGRKEGRKEGREAGSMLRIVQIAGKKFRKGISAEDAADMLEESPEWIRKLYEAFREHPDWSEEEIYKSCAGEAK